MKKLLHVLLIAALSFPALGAARRPKRVSDSVLPLQNEHFKTFCTAFSINEVERLWMTAKHCVEAAEERGWEMRLNKGWAEAVYISPGFDDIAILQAEYAGVALKLAEKAPQVGDDLYIQGFPYGLPVLVTTRGILAAKGLPIKGRPMSDILDITVAGGNSGSPVFKDGKVIGLLWGGFVNSPHSLSIPWETLKRLTSEYWR